MKNYEQKNKLKFKLLANFYDLFDLFFLLDKNCNPRHALAHKIPNETLNILDLCVGTANSSIVVAELNDRNKIFGIDLSRDMINIAEDKIEKRGIQNISIYQMDAKKMNFQGKEFDIAMVSYGLHEMKCELMIEVLIEVHRVLKDGGKLYILDYERESGLIKSLIFSVYLSIFEPKHMSSFFKYDWAKILMSTGFKITDMEKYFFSKLISATKHSKIPQFNKIDGKPS